MIFRILREIALEKKRENKIRMASSTRVTRSTVRCKDWIRAPWEVSYSAIYTQPTMVP